ncbi:3623_t:CDS:1 [Cetraspora pellucida]|uniref:3623_t:CDS:1 n=1 Tax=Cetraspora pellucida TaxID=1433469 RepID=A0ACA9K8A4_9GLOM|nr:3623_t:CDS:1 [Cetraspora pellucida]
MDAEARRKHCGLLMFDAPTVSTRSQTSRSNDIIINNMSTRGVDSSALNNNLSYESSRNASSMINDFDIFQDCTSDFSTTTRALAAGAAAGDDFIHHGSGDLSNGDESVQRNGHPQKRTPRPPNAFILYRREKQPAIIAANRHLSNAEVSRRISNMWKSEPEETRREWERYADRKKLEHMQAYPNYVYRPNKNKSKVDKRRQQRKQTSPRDSTDNRNYSVSTGTTGPLRRKSTRSGNKSPAKSDFTEGLQQSPINMSPQDTNMTPRNEPTNSSYTILPSLPSPEIPTLVDPPVEYGSQQQINPVTSHLPLTPISPPQMQCEQEFKVRQQQYDPNLLRYVPGGIQVYHNQGNAPQLPFTSMDGFIPSYNPLEYYITSDVPDVAQQQQQMNAETMLHYEQHQITHTPTVSSSNNPSPNERTSLYPQQPAQYYHNGTNTAGNVNSNPTYLNFLAGYECQNFLGGSVNHHIQ